LEHLDDFSIQLGMSSSQLTFTPSFFRGVGQPPTSYWLLYVMIVSQKHDDIELMGVNLQCFGHASSVVTKTSLRCWKTNIDLLYMSEQTKHAMMESKHGSMGHIVQQQEQQEQQSR
jgi:hypothetical protein